MDDETRRSLSLPNLLLQDPYVRENRKSNEFETAEKISFTVEDFEKSMKFKPRSSDIIIAGCTKSGTTWLQQIVHQLKSGGDMNFEEITFVVPIIEILHSLGIGSEEEQQYNPRCYKSHLQYHMCPKGGKYVVLFRDPCAVSYSSYNYFKQWLIGGDKIPREKFIMDYFLSPYSHYYKHLISWWKQRHDPNIMFIFYEEMKENHERGVRAIAHFMGIKDEKNIAIAVKQSTFEFMKENVKKFDTHYIFKQATNRILYPKVATGSADKALRDLSDVEKEAIQTRWDETVFKETGFKNYNEFRNSFRSEKPLIVLAENQMDD